MATLQIRVKDTSTVLFDFENPTGAGNPSSLKSRIMSLDPGGNTKETGWFSPSNRDGDTLVYSRNGRRTISLSLLLQGSASDFDSLRAGVEALVKLLQDGTGKDIYWVADSDVRRIDFHTADISRVLDGSHEGSVHALTSGKIIGFPVTLYCDPFERSEPLDPAVNKLVNPTLLLDVNGDGRPDGWLGVNFGGGTVIWIIDAETESAKTVVTPTGAGNHGHQQDLLGLSAGQEWELSADVKGSGGNYVLHIDYRDSTDVRTQLFSATAVLPATFTRVTVSGVAPATTTQADINLYASGTSGVLLTTYYRRAQVQRLS